MDVKEFVSAWKREKDYLAKEYLEKHQSEVARNIKRLGLSNDQKLVFDKIIDDVLSDTFYTLLLGLDGSASIGGIQHSYKIFEEIGNMISNGDGQIESEAWDQFQR